MTGVSRVVKVQKVSKVYPDQSHQLDVQVDLVKMVLMVLLVGKVVKASDLMSKARLVLKDKQVDQVFQVNQAIQVRDKELLFQVYVSTEFSTLCQKPFFKVEQ